jgi:SAM-dependent methyltransferase
MRWRSTIGDAADRSAVYHKQLKRLGRYLQRMGTALAGADGSDEEYARRLRSEKGQFDECLNVHELPDIFHYWSNQYLRPMFEVFGFSSPNDFFLQSIRGKCAQDTTREIAIVSIGAGNCDLEIDIGERLLSAGLGNFHIDCLEINENMLERARARVGDGELASKLRFLQQDFNRWQPRGAEYHVVMANQSLHHVLELEHLFDSIRRGLAPGGVFLTST